MQESPQEVTQLLQAWSAGEQGALDRLAPVVYRELHRLAQRYMAHERPGQTLQATALVNEAYLRLVDVKQVSWQNRAHFFGVSAQFMRRILVERARARRTLKRGSDGPAVALDEALLVPPSPGLDLVALDDALKDLAALDPRRAQVVELRFFERPESQRSAFLREACAGDEDLRREVESLLAYEKQGERFMETHALQVAARELAREDAPLSPGTRLGPYQILAPIGAGGMGAVYRAHDSRLTRDVAIKVLPAGMAGDPERIARFEREARAASALNHPNIVSVYDVGRERDTFWMATELVVGETLRTLIDRGPLPLRKTVDIAIQISAGLAAAHAGGIVHRDLKPGNIMVTREGRVKILDFGLAKQRRTGPHGSLPEEITHTGAIMGTAAYMSPEQVRGEPADQRSDIFCLGLILHEMVSGKRTYTGDSSVHVMHAILTQDPPELPAAVPPAVVRLVSHCLEKEPAARFQSAADIGFALESVAGLERSTTAHRPATAPANLLAAALVLVTLLLAALAFLYFQQRPRAQQVVRMSVLLPEKSRAVFLAVSPDGREIAMVLVNEGRQQIWVRPLDALEPTALAGTNGALDPFWSPDSRYIAFFADAKLKKIEHTGGPVQTLCDALGTYGGTWNRNGDILFGGLSHPLKIPAAGGNLSDLPDHAVVESYPTFLPDGQHYLAARGSSGSPEAGVWVNRVNGPAIRRILPDSVKTDIVEPAAGSTVGQVLFTRNGTLMALPFDMKRLEPAGDPLPIVRSIVSSYASQWLAASSPAGVLAYVSGQQRQRQYMWRDRQGKILDTVPDAGDVVAISPDGKWLVGDRSDGTWVIPIGPGTDTRLLISGPGNGNTVWSPDGRYVAHSMNGGFGRVPANGGGNREMLYRGKGLLLAPKSWSPDGRFILYVQVIPGTPADLFAVDIQHDSKPIPIAATPANEDQGQFSPDGHWVAYTSNESGVSEIYVVPFPPDSGGKWQVSRGGGVQPRWRRDGKELFYISPDSKLMAVQVKTQPVFQSDTPQTLFMTDLIDTGIRTGPLSWDVGPDGRFVFITESSIDASVTVVLNRQ